MSNNKKNMFAFYFVLVPCSVLLFGCSATDEKVLCSISNEEMGIKHNIEVVAVLNNDLVSKVSATMSYDSESDMNIFCDVLKNVPSNELRFTCNGKTIKIKNYDELLVNSNISVLNSTKFSFVEKMEQNGFDCN